jgi:hypothetical protein
MEIKAKTNEIETKNTKNQQNKKLVLWKAKQSPQILGKSNKKWRGYMTSTWE